MRSHLICRLIFSLVLGVGSTSAAVINGGFETDTAPTSGTATGWTAGGFGTVPGSGGVRNDSLSLSGNYFLLDGPPGAALGLSQTISHTTGQPLFLSGDYATRRSGAGSESFVIQVLDPSFTVLFQQTYNPTASGVWTAFSVTTSPIAANSVRILFIGQANGFDDDYMIDNISTSGVPEPASWTLLAFALPAVWRFRKR